jgi:hypothetical protein
VARPTMLSDEVRDRLLKAVRAGAPYVQAARAAGIHDATFRRWMARGEEEQQRQDDDQPPDEHEEPFRAFRAAVLRARADTAVRGVALIQQAAAGGAVIREVNRRYRDPESGQMVEETEVQRAAPEWRAAAWLLERAFREDFGRGPVEVTGPGGGPLEVSERSLAELAARVRANVEELAAARALPAGD